MARFQRGCSTTYRDRCCSAFSQAHSLDIHPLHAPQSHVPSMYCFIPDLFTPIELTVDFMLPCSFFPNRASAYTIYTSAFAGHFSCPNSDYVINALSSVSPVTVVSIHIEDPRRVCVRMQRAFVHTIYTVHYITQTRPTVSNKIACRAWTFALSRFPPTAA